MLFVELKGAVNEEVNIIKLNNNKKLNFFYSISDELKCALNEGVNVIGAI